jgi:hypothetical protein
VKRGVLSRNAKINHNSSCHVENDSASLETEKGKKKKIGLVPVLAV